MAARSNTGRSGRARGGQPKTRTIQPKANGQKPITYKPGGLHQSLGIPQGQKIPPAKMQAALRGDYGPKAAEQARFANNVLTGPKTGGASKTTKRTRGASRG